MKILRTTIHNFGVIGHAEIDLDEKGLVLIQGVNEDDTSQTSNGAGKSTIPDALCWCFFDKTAKEETGDAVINRTAKKDCYVETILVDEDTDDVFRITRHRKHKTHKNSLRVELEQGVNWKDLTKGTDKLTQVVVNRIIGCNHEVFTSSIYAGQEVMPDLPGMTDKQLKVLIEESAGIAQLQDADVIARRHVNERKADAQALMSKCAQKQATIDVLSDQAKDTEDAEKAFEVARTTDVAVLEDDFNTASAAFDKDVGDKIIKRVTALKVKIAASQALIDGSQAERDEEARLQQVLFKAQSAHENAERTAANDLTAARNAKHTLDHAADKVGTDCGECGHTIQASDLNATRDQASTAVLNAVARAQASKAAVAQALKDADSASSALTVHRASMTDVSATSASMSDDNETVSKLMQAKSAWDASATALTQKQKAVEARNTQKNPHTEVYETTHAKILIAQEELDDLEEQRVEKARELFTAEQAARVFSPAGVRAHILDTVTPHLNNRTSHYLSTLTDGNVSAVWSTISSTAKGELREKFVIEVTSSTGGDSFKSLSGGEKRKVRLACAMALQDLVASRASKPINLFIADEIDHALDPAGLERLMTILESKSRDKGTVLVISHTDLRDNIRNSVTVTKKGGYSTLGASVLSV